MMASCSNEKNPFMQEWDTPYGIPPFDKISLSDYIPAVKAGIKQQEKECRKQPTSLLHQPWSKKKNRSVQEN